MSRSLLAPIVLGLALASCGHESPQAPTSPDSRGGNVSPTITLGPNHLGIWSPNVPFEWQADPAADHYEWTLARTADYLKETGSDIAVITEIISWLTDRPGWTATTDLGIEFSDLETSSNGDLWIFAVRSVDGDGAAAGLMAPTNFRIFRVLTNVSGPLVSLQSNLGGCWSSADATTSANIFRTGLRFTWQASPGSSGSPPVLTEWAIGSPENWTPADEGGGVFPPEGEAPWIPDAGPVTFWVRTHDLAGFERVLGIELNVLEPRGRGVLAVIDTPTTGALESDGAVSSDYDARELELVTNEWLGNRDLTVLPARGQSDVLDAEVLARVSTIVWVHGASAFDGDSSTLRHTVSTIAPDLSLLASWRQAGGNLVICGVNPTDALRYLARPDCGADYALNDPIDFAATLDSPDYIPHLAATQLAWGSTEQVVRNTVSSPTLQLAVARSQRPGWPDLPFDPSTVPNGSSVQGFGYYDRGISPLAPAEVVYTADDTGSPIAIAQLAGPGRHGSTVVLGFHPFFVDPTAAGALFDVMLDSFGERRVTSSPIDFGR
ncbi:MAG: hypothetical protein R3B81_07340 [bacterium]